MGKRRRARVLEALADGGWYTGLEIGRRLGYGAFRCGTLYAALAELERDGKISARWQDHPRRRVYALR